MSIDLSQLVSLEIESLDSSFYGCISLESIDLTYFNTPSLTKSISMFKDCSSLKSIDLSYLNTSLVTDMNNMFSGCSSLESIDLSHLNTTKVFSMKSMFSGCESLEYLDLSYLDFSSCTDISSMLLKCISLKVLDMSSVDLKKVKQYSDMFSKVDLRYINLYNTKNFSPDEFINKMKNLTVCQAENILNNTNYQYKCCYFNITSDECEITNFIKIYYEEDAIYTNGFGLIDKIDNKENDINQFRKDRDSYFIIYKNYKTELKSDDAFTINKEAHLEIYFLNEVTDMSNFFNAEIDDNLKKIKNVEFKNFYFPLNNMKSMLYGCSSLKSIDISEIDTTLVTDMSQIFSGCSSLESIDLSNFNTSSLTNMNSMFNECNSLKLLNISSFNTSSVLDMKKLFYGCNELTSIDLSNFVTNKVENMNSMFYHCSSLEIIDLSNFDLNSINDLNNLFEGCSSLKYLDISAFNLEKFNSIDSLFKDNKNLEYLNLDDVNDPNGVITQNGISDWKSLKVCQKDIIMTSSDNTIINNECCYYNLTSQMCENNNYIKIYFAEDVKYEKGFIYDDNGEELRKGIDFIINGNYDHKLNGNENLIIKAGTKLEIYFSNPIDSLENYFSSTYDANSDKIISIDFTHFNSSLLTNMKNIFYKCSSLKNIDFTKFDSSLVTDMSSMFEGCSSLEILDLSYFDTSSVENMDSMFSGCSSLQFLDISHFNLEKINKLDSMFKDVQNLEYINLYNVKNADMKFAENELYNINNLTVCQKGYAKIIKSDKIIEKCCYYDYNSESDDKCFYTNYIILYYGSQAEYKNGFINDGNGEEFRSGIKFMISRNHNLKRSYSEKLIIPSGIKLEIYFSSPIVTLANYFNSDFDVNADKIVSIDFSHFETKEIKNMESMLSGCISLESVDFDNFNTSKVVNMKKIFYGCSQIESIDLSFFTTSSVTSMNEMFYDCNSLTSLDISNFDMINCDSYSDMFSNISSMTYLNLKNFKNDKVIGSTFKTAKDLVVCQKKKIINNPRVYYCCDYNFETKECETIPTNIISSIPTFIPEISNANVQTSDIQDINPSNQNSNDLIYSDEKETYPKDSTEPSNIFDDTENFSETKEFIHSTDYSIEDTTIKTSYLIIDKAKASTSIIEENSYNEKNTESLSSTIKNNIEYSTSISDNINEKTNKIDSEEYDTSNIDGTEKMTSRIETQNPIASQAETPESTIPKLDSKEPNTSEIDTKEPITSETEAKEPITSKVETEEPKIETKEPITSKVETQEPKVETKEPITSKVDIKEPISSMIDTQISKTSKVDTQEPITSQEETQGQTDSKLDTKEPMTSKIENTEKSSSQNEYNTQKTSSPDVEKTYYESTKTSIIDNKEQTSITSSINDNKEQITNIPSNKDNTEQSTNSQIDEKITPHATNEIIDKTNKPSNMENTSIIDNTGKANTQAPIKENTEKVISTSSLPEQMTNKPSINKEIEETNSPSNQEDSKHETSSSANYQAKTTTFSPDEETSITNKDDNKEIAHTTIPTSLNLTSLSTNLVENPKSTIIENIVQNTEEINTQEESGVTLFGLSHFNIVEKIIKFIIYFSLSGLFAGSKRVKFPVELTSRRVLRVLQTQEAVCELIEEEGKGDMYAYLCEVETTSIQSVKNVKIVKKFEFSAVNYTVVASVSPIVEQYLDNIQEIGNKFDFLMNSTLYILENSKIDLLEKQVFNISGIINGTKPKFEKVDLNLSVSAEYENKTEEKQIECSIIDIIENNYTLSCIGMKNTNFSLKNAMSVIEDEILMIKFGENENTTILYYADETKTKYSIVFFNNKNRSIGAGGIIAIILACLAAVAALIITFKCFKIKEEPTKIQESTIENFKI